jgi:hypothetical protein
MRSYDDRILRSVYQDGGEFACLVHSQSRGEEVTLLLGEGTDGFSFFGGGIVGDT